MMQFKLKAEIIGFYKSDLHFDYDDGSFEWFDSTKLKILKPAHLKEKEFYIYHNECEIIDNIWTQIGRILSIEIDEKTITNWENLFNSLIFSNGIFYK